LLAHVLSAPTEDGLELAAVQLLVAKGYIVEMAGEWETPGELCARLGVSPSRFRRKMGQINFAPTVKIERGEKGRLRKLRSSPAFDRWICNGKK
jgi:hypothetical protein